MGNRFTRCFSIVQYSVVDTNLYNSTHPNDGHPGLEAIALVLDEEESENPGLILDERFEV